MFFRRLFRQSRRVWCQRRPQQQRSFVSPPKLSPRIQTLMRTKYVSPYWEWARLSVMSRVVGHLSLLLSCTNIIPLFLSFSRINGKDFSIFPPNPPNFYSSFSLEQFYIRKNETKAKWDKYNSIVLGGTFPLRCSYQKEKKPFSFVYLLFSSRYNLPFFIFWTSMPPEESSPQT